MIKNFGALQLGNNWQKHITNILTNNTDDENDIYKTLLLPTDVSNDDIKAFSDSIEGYTLKSKFNFTYSNEKSSMKTINSGEHKYSARISSYSVKIIKD